MDRNRKNTKNVSTTTPTNPPRSNGAWANAWAPVWESPQQATPRVEVPADPRAQDGDTGAQRNG